MRVATDLKIDASIKYPLKSRPLSLLQRGRMLSFNNLLPNSFDQDPTTCWLEWYRSFLSLVLKNPASFPRAYPRRKYLQL